jgi:TonB family protein
MASYSRLDSFILAGDLAQDPCGKLHRGLTITGNRFDRHKLIRTFSDELLEAGFGARVEDANKLLPLLSGARGFAAGSQAYAGKVPHLACDYVGGRSLAQLLAKAKQEQIPLGVDHALSVLQSVSQSLILLHTKGAGHGLLSPHSIWVSFEGATHLLDAPYSLLVQPLLPKCPVLARTVAPYRPAPGASPLQQDFFALGMIFLELLTFDVPPPQNQVAQVIANATLKAAQEEGPIPAEIQRLLRRLLMVESPFESAQDFTAELERVLYDGDYSPTTFNMAFFMHTLFREENEHDLAAMKEDATADYAPLTSTEGGGGAQALDVDTGRFVRYALIGGGVLALLLAALLWSSLSKNKQNAELMAKITQLEEEKKAADARIQANNMEKANLAQKLIMDQAALKNAKSPAEQERLRKAIEDTKAREQKLAEQQAKDLKQKEMIQQNQQALANKPVPAPQQTQPTQVPPAPQPVPQQQTAPAAQAPPPVQQQAPTPTPAIQAPQQAQTAPPVPETDAQILTRATASMPIQARNMGRGRSFTVKVRVYVDAAGRPAKTTIEQGSGFNYGLEDSALKAAQASTYQAATRDGKPIASWMVVIYQFKI